MAVLNDYECLAHGHFESTEPKCPSGCSRAFVQVVFLKAVGTRSGKTRFVDTELKRQAEQYGLTNLKTGQRGESVMQAMARTEKRYPDEAAAFFEGQIPHNKPGWSQRKEPPKTFDMSALGTNYGKGLNPESDAWKGVLRPPQANTVFVGKSKTD